MRFNQIHMSEEINRNYLPDAFDVYLCAVEQKYQKNAVTHLAQQIWRHFATFVILKCNILFTAKKVDIPKEVFARSCCFCMNFHKAKMMC